MGASPSPSGWPAPSKPSSGRGLNQPFGPAAQKGPDARRRPMGRARRTPGTSQRAREGDNAAGGPFSAAGWILGWGAGAEVPEPARLRREIAAEARKIAEREG
jgi:WYL domain